MKKHNKGITLIALVITIIVLLILAGISIAMLTGENGILTKADTATRETERNTIIEEARIKILEKQTDNLGTLTQQELTAILEPTYGTLSNNGEENVLDKILTTTDGKYEILVKEIYTGNLTQKDEIGTCYIDSIESTFHIGSTWEDEPNILQNFIEHAGGPIPSIDTGSHSIYFDFHSERWYLVDNNNFEINTKDKIIPDHHYEFSMYPKYHE